MNGFMILLRKELLESWRTLRIPIVAGLFLFVGLSSPLLARYMAEIIRLAGGEQLGVIEIPPPTVADAVDQLLKNLVQFGALAAILLAMGAVATERERGTAAFVLAKPVTRGAFLAAKLVALAVVLAGATILAVAVGWLYTAILFEPLAVTGWVWLAALTWLGLYAYAVITFLASAVTGSSIAAAGIGFLALLVLSIVAAIPNIGRFVPAALGGPAHRLAIGAATPGDLGGDLFVPIVASVALIAVAMAAARWSFGRQEL
jgi:ABC-2 type transport system permease protein